MAASDVLLRVQELGGAWLPVGSEKSRGIWIDPTNFSADADGWGSRQLQAQLRIDPRALQPHISAFTPWELEIGGVQYASGRISETPSQDGDDRSVTVTGEGWQYHLDDDAYQRTYVHTALSDYVDVRGLLTAQLGQAPGYHPASCQVSADQNGITLMFPKDIIIGQFEGCSVQLDLGPDNTATRVVCDITTSNNDASSALFGFIGNDDRPQQGTSTLVVSSAINVASATLSGTVTPGQRYLSFRLQRQGAAATPGADIWVKITRVLVFSDTSYESGGLSILVGSTIVQDAIARATLLLSPDLSQVTPTTFQIPEYAMTSDQTPRQVITSATAFDDVIARITVEKQISLRPRPQLPIYEVGDWSGAEFQDASTNSGDQIYNAVKVTGTDATGSPVKVTRNQVPSFFSPSAIQPSNPSATTNTTGWAAFLGATLSRDTVTFDTTPGSFKVALVASGVFFQGVAATSAWT